VNLCVDLIVKIFRSTSSVSSRSSLPPDIDNNKQLSFKNDSPLDFKGFFSQIDWPALQKDFSLKKNTDLRHVYRARFSKRERDLIKVQWTRKMIESQKHILFFDFLQKYFPSDNAIKQNFVKEDKIVVQSSQKNIEKIEKMHFDLKINQNKASTSVIQQKKTNDFPDTDSIPLDSSFSDNLNHMNCRVLTKFEEKENLFLTLISKIENLELKEKYLKKLKKKDANKTSKSKISLDETLEKFSKQKSKVATISDLQHEISIIKKDIVNLKKDFHNSKIDNKNLEQEISRFKNCFQDHNSDNEDNNSKHSPKGDSSNSLNSHDVKIISLINKIILPKWYAQDYAFDVIVLIDSDADLNCIQEGLIPSKYFEKSTEKLNSASGSKLQIKYELNNVHVCQDNVCFHVPSVLVKNMTNKVILGIPFIFMFYPFTAEEDGVSTVKMGVPVKFHFVSRFYINVSQFNFC
jgi:hypothetical protein